MGISIDALTEEQVRYKKLIVKEPEPRGIRSAQVNPDLFFY
jgi:hypothetical protein